MRQNDGTGPEWPWGGGPPDQSPGLRWPGGPFAPLPSADPHDVRVEQERLREIREGLPAAVGPLSEVIENLVGLAVAEATFTAFTYSLALAYNEVEAFTLQELRGKVEDAAVIREKVGASAANWAYAEQASMVKGI